MKADPKMVTKTMFRLLPIQVILAAVGSVNSIVSTYFASNFVGVNAMAAVGLYFPLNLFIGAVSIMLVGGATILCGSYMGKNQQEGLQNAYSLAIAVIADMQHNGLCSMHCCRTCLLPRSNSMQVDVSRRYLNVAMNVRV